MPRRMVDSALDVLNVLKAKGVPEVFEYALVIRELRAHAGGAQITINRYKVFFEEMELLQFLPKEERADMTLPVRINWAKVEKMEGV